MLDVRLLGRGDELITIQISGLATLNLRYKKEKYIEFTDLTFDMLHIMI